MNNNSKIFKIATIILAITTAFLLVKTIMSSKTISNLTKQNETLTTQVIDNKAKYENNEALLRSEEIKCVNLEESNTKLKNKINALEEANKRYRAQILTYQKKSRK